MKRKALKYNRKKRKGSDGTKQKQKRTKIVNKE